MTAIRLHGLMCLYLGIEIHNVGEDLDWYRLEEDKLTAANEKGEICLTEKGRQAVQFAIKKAEEII